MLRFADNLEANREELETLDCNDNGFNIELAQFSVSNSIETIRYSAGACERIEGTCYSRDWDNKMQYVKKEPIGVCGLITPWNFPLMMLAWKIGPHMASGCTGVYKVPELTPLSALRTAEILHNTEGCVPGAFNFLPGLGSVTGHALTGHPDVRKIAFTGGTTRAKEIIKRCSDTLKSTTMELGGKSPFIVFDDADLEKAALTAAQQGTLSAGQCCASPTRLLVQESVHDRFVELLVKAMKSIKVGAFNQEGTQMGPLISEERFAVMDHYISSAKREGATIACGGKRIDRPGNFFEPTVITNATN